MNTGTFDFPNLLNGDSILPSEFYPAHSGSTIMRMPRFTTTVLPNGAEVVVDTDGELTE